MVEEIYHVRGIFRRFVDHSQVTDLFHQTDIGALIFKFIKVNILEQLYVIAVQGEDVQRIEQQSAHLDKNILIRKFCENNRRM